MVDQALLDVFTHAAFPQKVVLTVLVAAIPFIVVAALIAARGGAAQTMWSPVIGYLRIGGPALGLLTGGLNSFHMGETIMRVPFDPTLKQLAPGIFEVSTLVSLGASVGIVALAAQAAVSFAALRRSRR